MKIVLNILAALVLCAGFHSTALAQTPTDYLGVPGPIDFDGARYDLAWTSRPSPNYVKQEYVPAGQGPESYESMVLVEFIEADLTPMALAKAQTDMLDQRKGSDPLVNSSVVRNDATGEVILDFLMSTKDAAGEYIVEWNGYRYANVTTRDGRRGGMLFAISRRAYGNDAAQAFLTQLRTMKEEQILILARAALPEL